MKILGLVLIIQIKVKEVLPLDLVLRADLRIMFQLQVQVIIKYPQR
jgi:hypothetical protein